MDAHAYRTRFEYFPGFNMCLYVNAGIHVSMLIVPMAGARACHAHVRKNEREEGRMKKKE